MYSFQYDSQKHSREKKERICLLSTSVSTTTLPLFSFSFILYLRISQPPDGRSRIVSPTFVHLSWNLHSVHDAFCFWNARFCLPYTNTISIHAIQCQKHIMNFIIFLIFIIHGKNMYIYLSVRLISDPKYTSFVVFVFIVHIPIKAPNLNITCFRRNIVKMRFKKEIFITHKVFVFSTHKFSLL